MQCGIPLTKKERSYCKICARFNQVYIGCTVEYNMTCTCGHPKFWNENGLDYGRNGYKCNPKYNGKQKDKPDGVQHCNCEMFEEDLD